MQCRPACYACGTVTEGRGNGYVVLPVALLTGSFLLPLFARLGSWLDLPAQTHLALPLLLVGLLAGLGTWRRNAGRTALPAGTAPGKDPAETRKDIV